MAASIGVYGMNREDDPPLSPPSPNVTLLSVVGEGFPPEATVSLKVEKPPIGNQIRANGNGAFLWEETIRHQLGEGAALAVVATYADPKNPDSPLTVHGEATVAVVVFEHGHAT